MFERRQKTVLFALAFSAVLHGAAYASLGLAPRRPTELPSSAVVLEVNEPAPPLVKPEPKPEPPPAKPEATQPLAPAPAPRAAEPPKLAPPPEAKAAGPVDLSGVTLSNDNGDASWASPLGDGSAWSGPLAGVRPGVTPISATSAVAVRAKPAPAAASSAPAIVPVSDLSTKPQPPALDAALRANYPAEARARAISGSASLRLRIDPDGRARNAAVLSESFSGFGEACRRALLNSAWTAPRDQSGRAVATEVRYTCRFVVE